MAFSDVLYLIIGAFALIVVVLAMDYVQNSVMTSIGPKISPTNVAKIDKAWDQNRDFMNTGFIAMFIILAMIGVILSALVSSHPVFLVAWLLFNLVVLFVWDNLVSAMDAITSSSINTGNMNDAINFFKSDMAKVVVFVNILVALGLFGKRMVSA